MKIVQLKPALVLLINKYLLFVCWWLQTGGGETILYFFFEGRKVAKLDLEIRVGAHCSSFEENFLQLLQFIAHFNPDIKSILFTIFSL